MNRIKLHGRRISGFLLCLIPAAAMTVFNSTANSFSAGSPGISSSPAASSSSSISCISGLPLSESSSQGGEENSGSGTISEGPESSGAESSSESGSEENGLGKGSLMKPVKNINLEPIGADVSAETSAGYDSVSGVCTFAYKKNGKETTYTIRCHSENIQKGILEVFAEYGGKTVITAVAGAGACYRSADGSVLSPEAFAQAAQVNADVRFSGGQLILNYTDFYEGVTTQKTYTIRIQNETLVIRAESGCINGNNGYCAFTSGKAVVSRLADIESCVFAEASSVTVVDGACFLSAYLDQAKSYGTSLKNAPSCVGNTSVHGMTAYYDLNSADQTNPLDETFYVTLSDDFLDCVYRTNAKKSQYRDLLNDRIIYDTWEYAIGYSERRRHFEDLALQYGMKDVLLIDHRWQRDTLDISNPVFYPASTSWGTAEEFQNYIGTVMNRLGWMLALHEDYWFIYPSSDNPYWNTPGVEDKIAQDKNGIYRFGWLTTSYANKSDAMLEYSKIESTRIKENYQTNAAFLDVNGGVDPSVMNQVTLDAKSVTSRTLAQVVADNAALFESMKDTYKGPIMTEGAQGERSFGSVYAGYIDAIEREITDCSDGRIMPDNELIHVRPLMANQGMGYPSRFEPGVGTSQYNFDKYNTMAVAYGHSGFIGEIHNSVPDEQVKTYYMFRAIQPQYLDTAASVEEITYYSGNGAKYSLSDAVKANYNFRASRLFIRYSNGLKIFLNFSGSTWTVALNGHSYALDPNGYAAENPAIGFTQYSCLRNGVRVDYADCAEYTYADPRGNRVDFGNGLVTDTIKVIHK